MGPVMGGEYRGLGGNARRPRLLLMGQKRRVFLGRGAVGWRTVGRADGVSRSGKSSISSVVFHKMPPTETLFLESTTRIQKDPIQ